MSSVKKGIVIKMGINIKINILFLIFSVKPIRPSYTLIEDIYRNIVTSQNSYSIIRKI